MSSPVCRANQSSAADPAGRIVLSGHSILRVFAVEENGAILIIDDEPSVADAVRLILEDLGHRVLVAASAGGGLELARRGGLRLVITDLCLPDFSGLELLGALRAEQPLLPVVVITSHGTPDIFAEAKYAGAAAVLAKPFAPAEIIRLVESLARAGEDGGQ